MRVTLLCGSADDFNYTRHSNVSMTNFNATTASDTGNRQFTLDEKMVQFSEKTPVAPIMHCVTGIVSASHPCEAAEGTGVPNSHPLEFVRSDLTIGNGETGADWTNKRTSTAFHAAIANFLPCFVAYPAGGYITDSSGEPGGSVFKLFTGFLQNNSSSFNVGRSAFFVEWGAKKRFTGRCARHSHILITQVHQLQVEIFAGGRTGIATQAKALFTDVQTRVGADNIYQKQILPFQVVIGVFEIPTEEEAVLMEDTANIAGPDTEQCALGSVVRRLKAQVAIVFLEDLHGAFQLGEHETLDRVIGVGNVDFNLVAIVV
jgi:hypothetical protein